MKQVQGTAERRPHLTRMSREVGTDGMTSEYSPPGGESGGVAYTETFGAPRYRSPQQTSELGGEIARLLSEIDLVLQDQPETSTD